MFEMHNRGHYGLHLYYDSFIQLFIIYLKENIYSDIRNLQTATKTAFIFVPILYVSIQTHVRYIKSELLLRFFDISIYTWMHIYIYIYRTFWRSLEWIIIYHIDFIHCSKDHTDIILIYIYICTYIRSPLTSNWNHSWYFHIEITIDITSYNTDQSITSNRGPYSPLHRYV